MHIAQFGDNNYGPFFPLKINNNKAYKYITLMYSHFKELFVYNSQYS